MDTEHPVFEKIKSLDTYHVTEVACGWDSSLAVTKDGELFVWGSNAYGQLGLPKKVIIAIFGYKILVPLYFILTIIGINDMMPSRLSDRNQSFRGTCYLIYRTGGGVISIVKMEAPGSSKI